MNLNKKRLKYNYYITIYIRNDNIFTFNKHLKINYDIDLLNTIEIKRVIYNDDVMNTFNREF